MLKNKILDAVKRLNLDLKGKVVLTEAASGAYVITPVIAALAGAEVYAFTKNTRYGTVEEIRKLTNDLAESFDCQLSITIIEELTPEIISKADIITNSGHLRPLTKEKLQHAKDGVVIPLMYETWELREGDLDLNYCKERNFKLAGTNERHADVDVFNYLGDMAVKFVFDSGSCLYKNKLVLISNNDFGSYIAKVLSKNCETLGVIDRKENKGKYELNEKCVWLADYPDVKIPDEFKNAEAVVYTAHPFDSILLGDKSKPINVEVIKKSFSVPYILRYAGDIDTELCKQEGIRFYPEHVKSGHMGIIPSEIGVDPILRLQSGSLKVGELLLKREKEYKGQLLAEYI